MDHSIRRRKILSNINKRPGLSASVRHQSLCWNVHWKRLECGRGWIGDLLIAETEDLKTMPPFETHVQRFKSKEMDIQKRERICIPMQDGRNTARRTAVIHRAGGDLKQEFQETSSVAEGEIRDPSPDLEARQEFRISRRDYKYRTHDAPRTKLCVPKDDFPIPLTYKNVQRETKISLDEFHEAIIDDFGTWMAKSHCLNPGSV